MTSLANKLFDTYNYVFYDLADPRMSHYFLISSPWPIVTLTCLYLYICTSLGPKYMKDRPPYNLKNVVLVYNVFQVLMSTYLFSQGVHYICSKEFSFNCDPIDYSDKPRALWIAAMTWWYFFTKVIEFLDTVFFVLRKKNNQISFLHVYHHSLMAFTMWIGVKYFPGGHAVVMGTLNAFVHIVMYTYYLIAGLGPKYQKYIWWKKHVTVLQMVQFVLILIHNINPLFNDCSYPKILNILLALNALLFINLFGRFFYASYNIKDKFKHSKSKTVENGTANNGTAKNALNENGIVKNRIEENGSVKNGIDKNGTVKNGTSNGNSFDGTSSGDTITLNEKHKDV